MSDVSFLRGTSGVAHPSCRTAWDDHCSLAWEDEHADDTPNAPAVDRPPASAATALPPLPDALLLRQLRGLVPHMVSGRARVEAQRLIWTLQDEGFTA